MQETLHALHVTYCCRVAPSLGALEGDHEYNRSGKMADHPVNFSVPMPAHHLVWGTETYIFSRDKNQPTVFMGLYDLRDYIALARHQGKAWVLWCGSDLQNLINGFVFNDGKLKKLSLLMRFKFVNKLLVAFLKRKAEHWVEDEDEYTKLKMLGIDSKICPSFMGDIEKFPVSYKQAVHPNVYISGHPGREDEYGFDFVEKLALRLPDFKFHLYGAAWEPKAKNITSHGRVPKDEFNRQIKHMQCGLRLNMSDGFSEITAKCVLMGQYPITYLRYPMIDNFNTPYELEEKLRWVKKMRKPYFAGREYYINALNDYPWNVKKHR